MPATPARASPWSPGSAHAGAALGAGRQGDQGADHRPAAPRSSDGVELVGAAGESAGRRSSQASSSVADLVRGDRRAPSREQANGIDEINSAVAQMDEMTQQNAALVEESAASAARSEGQAGMLGELISFFRVGGLAQQEGPGHARGELARGRPASRKASRVRPRPPVRAPPASAAKSGPSRVADGRRCRLEGILAAARLPIGTAPGGRSARARSERCRQRRPRVPPAPGGFPLHRGAAPAAYRHRPGLSQGRDGLLPARPSPARPGLAGFAEYLRAACRAGCGRELACWSTR